MFNREWASRYDNWETFIIAFNPDLLIKTFHVEQKKINCLWKLKAMFIIFCGQCMEVCRVLEGLVHPAVTWLLVSVVWYSLVLPGAHLLADPATPILPRLPRLGHAHLALAVALLPCKGEGHTKQAPARASSWGDLPVFSWHDSAGGSGSGAGKTSHWPPAGASSLITTAEARARPPVSSLLLLVFFTMTASSSASARIALLDFFLVPVAAGGAGAGAGVSRWSSTWPRSVTVAVLVAGCTTAIESEEGTVASSEGLSPAAGSPVAGLGGCSVAGPGLSQGQETLPRPLAPPTPPPAPATPPTLFLKHADRLSHGAGGGRRRRGEEESLVSYSESSCVSMRETRAAVSILSSTRSS